MSRDMSSEAKRALSRASGRVLHMNPGLFVSVEACQGNVAVCQGAKVLSPHVFDEKGGLGHK